MSNVDPAAAFESLKNQFKAEMQVELAKARIEQQQQTYAFRKEFDDLRAATQEALKKDTEDHRGFLEKLEESRIARTIVFGALGAAILGGFATFVLNNTVTMLKEDLAKTEAKMQLEVKDILGRDNVVRKAAEEVRTDLQLELNHQTATVLLGVLTLTKAEAESVAESSTSTGLEPEHARDLVAMIGGIFDRYVKRLGEGKVDAARRDALLLVANAITSLARNNRYSAERFLLLAQRRDHNLPDTYIALAFLYSLDYAYVSGGELKVPKEKQRDEAYRSLLDLPKEEIADYPAAQRAVARFYRLQKNFPEALRILYSEKAKNYSPLVLRDIAVCEWKVGNSAEAIKCNQEALNLDPNASRVRNDLLVMLTHKDVHGDEEPSLREGKEDQVLQLAETLAEHPAGRRYPVYLDTLAQAWQALAEHALRQHAEATDLEKKGQLAEKSRTLIQKARLTAEALLKETAKNPRENYDYMRKRAQKILDLLPKLPQFAPK